MAQQAVLVPEAEESASTTAELNTPLKSASDVMLGATVPFGATRQLSALLGNENFHVDLERPTEDPGMGRFAELERKIQEKGKDALDMAEELCFGDLIAKATFPDNPAAQRLAVKWVDRIEFGLQDLQTLEKVDLAYFMGQKTFPNDPQAAARYAASCFGLNDAHEKFQSVFELFLDYSPLPYIREY